MSRLVVLLVALTLLLPGPAALAQGGGAFDPLPPAQPTPAPTVVASDDPDDDDVGRTTLYVIGGLLVLAFAGLALWITRDARRAVPADQPRAAGPDPELLDERRHKMAQEAKVRARKKARAQRAARKRNRR